MVVDMIRPGSVEGDQTPSIDCSAEDILWHESSFVPEEHLILLGDMRNMFSLANSLKPVPVRVVPVFEPFIDEEICRVAIDGLADEL